MAYFLVNKDFSAADSPYTWNEGTYDFGQNAFKNLLPAYAKNPAAGTTIKVFSGTSYGDPDFNEITNNITLDISDLDFQEDVLVPDDNITPAHWEQPAATYSETKVGLTGSFTNNGTLTVAKEDVDPAHVHTVTFENQSMFTNSVTGTVNVTNAIFKGATVINNSNFNLSSGADFSATNVSNSGTFNLTNTSFSATSVTNSGTFNLTEASFTNTATISVRNTGTFYVKGANNTVKGNFLGTGTIFFDSSIDKNIIIDGQTSDGIEGNNVVFTATNAFLNGSQIEARSIAANTLVLGVDEETPTFANNTRIVASEVEGDENSGKISIAKNLRTRGYVSIDAKEIDIDGGTFSLGHSGKGVILIDSHFATDDGIVVIAKSQIIGENDIDATINNTYFKDNNHTLTIGEEPPNPGLPTSLTSATINNKYELVIQNAVLGVADAAADASEDEIAAANAKKVTINQTSVDATATITKSTVYAKSITNKGSITATNSTIDAASVTNNNGTFKVAGESTLEIDSLKGTIALENAAISGSNVKGGEFTVAAEKTAAFSGTNDLDSTITNNGAITVNGTLTAGAVTNNSGSSLTLAENATLNASSLTVDGGSSLSLGAGSTVDLGEEGDLISNVGLTITSATVIADEIKAEGKDLTFVSSNVSADTITASSVVFRTATTLNIGTITDGTAVTIQSKQATGTRAMVTNSTVVSGSVTTKNLAGFSETNIFDVINNTGNLTVAGSLTANSITNSENATFTVSAAGTQLNTKFTGTIDFANGATLGDSTFKEGSAITVNKASFIAADATVTLTVGNGTKLTNATDPATSLSGKINLVAGKNYGELGDYYQLIDGNVDNVTLTVNGESATSITLGEGSDAKTYGLITLSTGLYLAEDQTQETLYVSSEYAGEAAGTKINDHIVGYNAFGTLSGALEEASKVGSTTITLESNVTEEGAASLTTDLEVALTKDLTIDGGKSATINFASGDSDIVFSGAKVDGKYTVTDKKLTVAAGTKLSATGILGRIWMLSKADVQGALNSSKQISFYTAATVTGTIDGGDGLWIYTDGSTVSIDGTDKTFTDAAPQAKAYCLMLTKGVLETTNTTINADVFKFDKAGIAGVTAPFTLDSDNTTWNIAYRLLTDAENTGTFNFTNGSVLNLTGTASVSPDDEANLGSATISDKMTLNFDDSNMTAKGKVTNDGTINLKAVSKLDATGAVTNNASGVINVGEAGDDERSELIAGSITNSGTINAQADSKITAKAASTNKAGATINIGNKAVSAEDNDGTAIPASAATLDVSGDFTNNGTINVVSESGVTASGAVSNTNIINVGDEDSKGTLTAASITNEGTINAKAGSLIKATSTDAQFVLKNAKGGKINAYGSTIQSGNGLQNWGTMLVSGANASLSVGGSLYNGNNDAEQGLGAILTIENGASLTGAIFNYRSMNLTDAQVGPATGTGRVFNNNGTLNAVNTNFNVGALNNKNWFNFNQDTAVTYEKKNTITATAIDNTVSFKAAYADITADKITNSGTFTATSSTIDVATIDNSTEGAKFEMIGGSISGSTVTNAGTFNMIGGTITGSTVQGEGAFNLSDKVTLVDENKFASMNIAAGAAITVDGTLTVTSSIANAGTILIDATDTISATNAVYSGTGTIKLADTIGLTEASKTLITVKSGLSKTTITLGAGTDNLANNQVIELGEDGNKAKYQVVRTDKAFTLNAIGDCSKETLLVTTAKTLPEDYLLNYNAFRTLADAINGVSTTKEGGGITTSIVVDSASAASNQANLTVAAGIAITAAEGKTPTATIGFKGADQGLYLNPGNSITGVNITTTAKSGDAWTGSVYVNYAAAAGNAVALNGNIDAAGHIYFNGAATVTGDLKVANDRIVLLRAGKAGADNAVTIGRETEGTTAQVTGTWIELLSGKANFNNTIVDVTGLAYNNYTPVDGEYAAAPALVSGKTKWTLGFIQLDKAGLEDASFTFQNESTVTVNDAHGQNADHKAAAIGSGITFTLDKSSLTMTNADSVFNNAGTINLKNKAELTTNKLENIGTITTTDDTATVISATNIANGDTTKASIIEVGKLTATSSIVNNNGKVAVRGSTIHVADALDATGATIDNGLKAITPGTDAPACKAVIEAKTITAVSISNFGVIGSQTAELKHTLATITLTGDLTNGQYGNVMADSLTAANIVNSNELLVNAIDVTGTITNNAGAAIALNSGEGSTGHITIEADGSLTNAGYIKTLSGGSITVNALVNTGAAANNATFMSSELLGNSTLTLNNGLISTDSITVGTSITNSGTISAKSIQAAKIFSTSAGSVLEVANSIKQTDRDGFNFTNYGSLTLGSADDTELNTLTAAAILQNQGTGTITLNKVNASVKAINNSHSFTATGSVFTTNSGYETVNYANASFTLTNSTFTGKIDNRGTFTMNGGTLNAATLKNTGTFTLVGDFTKTVGDETVNTLSIGTLTGELTFKGVKLNGYTLESGAINVAGADATSFSGVNTFKDFSIASTGTLAIDAAETVRGHGPSLVVKGNFDNKGKITIDVTNLQWGTAITSLKVISVEGTLSSNSNIEITGTKHDDTMAVIMNTGAEKGIYLVKGEPVSIPTIALNSAWSNSCHVGDKVTIGQKEFIYGSSAFATIGDIVVTPDTTEIMVVGQTTEYAGTLSLNGQKLSIVTATDATAASAATFGALSFTGAVDVFATGVTATTTTFAAGAAVDLTKTTASLGDVTADGTTAADVAMKYDKALTVKSVAGKLNVAIDVTDYAGLSADKVVVDVTGDAAPANVTYSVIGTGSTKVFSKYFKKNNDTGDVSINAAARNLITVTNAADIMSATKGVNYSWTVGDDTYFADRVVIDTAIAGTGINAQYLQGNGSAITFVGDYTHAKAVYGGKLVTAVKDADIKTLPSDLGGNINITIDGNSTFNQFVFGGDRIDVRNANKGRNTFYRDADISLTINGGTFMRDVAAGMMFQGDYTKAAFEVNNTSLKITGGTFKEYVYGGNYATSNTASKKTTILEKATVTLVAGNDIDFEKTLFVGSIGNGNIFEGTELKLTGSNVDENFNQIAKLHASDIWGASAADKIITDGDTRILVGGVEGTRQLTFTGFTGIVDSKNIHGFSDVLVEKNSTAKLNETVNLSDVSNWTFEADSKLLGKFKNDFAGDKLALTGITAETNNWQLFEATGFTGAADLQVSFNGGDFVAYESGINGWSNGDYMLSASNWTYGLQSELAPAQLS